jgi:hypothetical protein
MFQTVVPVFYAEFRKLFLANGLVEIGFREKVCAGDPSTGLFAAPYS